jgi:hypothetical protein
MYVYKCMYIYGLLYVDMFVSVCVCVCTNIYIHIYIYDIRKEAIASVEIYVY